MKYGLRALGLASVLLVTACQAGGPDDDTLVADENFMGENMISSGGDPAEQIWCEVLEQQIPRKDCEAISKSAEVTDGSAALNVPDPMQRGDRTAVRLIVDRRTPEVIDALDSLDSTNAVDTGNALDANGNVDGEGPDSGSEDPALNQGDPAPGDVNVQDPAAEPPEPDPPANPNPTPKQHTDKMPGTTDKYDLKVGRRMRAELTGQGFTIIPQSPAVREIPKGDQASWTWEVIAEQGGPKTLTVTTVVEAAVNGRVYRLRQTEHHKTIDVGISFLDRIKDWLGGLPAFLQLITAALTALAGVAGAWWLVKRNWRSGPGGGGKGPDDGAKE